MSAQKKVEEEHITLSVYGQLRVPEGISRIKADSHSFPNEQPGLTLTYSFDAQGANEQEARERISEFRAQLVDAIRGKAQ